MSIAHLPYLPVSMGVLQESDFFLSQDPALVRAGFYMLDAAWRSGVPGSIPADFTSLVRVTRLDESKVQANYEALTQGWELREDGRIHHLKLSELIAGVCEQFGDQLHVMAQSAAVAMQGVSEFDLMPSDAVNRVAKKRQVVKSKIGDFCPDGASLASIVAGGYRSQEHQDWLVQSFKDYVASKSPKYRDVQATFRSYASSSITHNSFRSRFGAMPSMFLRTDLTSAPGVPSAQAVPTTRSFAARTLDENRAVLDQVKSARSAPCAAPAGPLRGFGRSARPVGAQPVRPGPDGVFDFERQ